MCVTPLGAVSPGSPPWFNPYVEWVGKIPTFWNCRVGSGQCHWRTRNRLDAGSKGKHWKLPAERMRQLSGKFWGSEKEKHGEQVESGERVPWWLVIRIMGFHWQGLVGELIYRKLLSALRQKTNKKPSNRKNNDNRKRKGSREGIPDGWVAWVNEQSMNVSLTVGFFIDFRWPHRVFIWWCSSAVSWDLWYLLCL